jgi:hypothetical protein
MIMGGRGCSEGAGIPPPDRSIFADSRFAGWVIGFRCVRGLSTRVSCLLTMSAALTAYAALLSRRPCRYKLCHVKSIGNWAGPLTFHVLGRTIFSAMKTSARLLQLLAGSILLASTSVTFAGTWSDHFSGSVLGSDWRGDRAYFSILDGALDGISAQPVAPVPLHQVEVGTNWGDYTVQCRIEVVTPNLLICTKGALILRDNGTDGYVFALHVATKTIEVYRLSDHKMLLCRDAPLELKKWYLVRAELQGTNMSFFVDNQFIGTVTDDRSLSGAVGVAVQDTMETLFDDFTVTGPGIPGNTLELSVGRKITLSWPASLTNYVLQATADLSATGAWNTVTNTPDSTSGQLTVTLDPSAGNHFYLLAPKSP